MWISTFHSACARILRSHADVLGYPSAFSIYDQADSRRLTRYVVRDLDLDPRKFNGPKAVHAAISTLKNQLTTPTASRSIWPRRPTAEDRSPARWLVSIPSTRSGCGALAPWTSTTC